MLRKTAPLAIALVIVFICIPAFADTVTYSSANSGTYTYEYTWAWTTEPGGFSTQFWIAVYPDVQSSGIFEMSTESGWTYQGVSSVGDSPTGKALLWTGSTMGANMGAKTHTFKVGSNVYGPGYTPGSEYTWQSNTSGGTGSKTGFTHAPAPEAGTLLLFASGLASLAGWGFRRRRGS